MRKVWDFVWISFNLTMVHIRKYFRGMDLAHVVSWKIPENGLPDLVLLK